MKLCCEVAAESIPAEESHEKEIGLDSSGLAFGAFLADLFSGLNDSGFWFTARRIGCTFGCPGFGQKEIQRELSRSQCKTSRMILNRYHPPLCNAVQLPALPWDSSKLISGSPLAQSFLGEDPGPSEPEPGLPGTLSGAHGLPRARGRAAPGTQGREQGGSFHGKPFIFGLWRLLPLLLFCEVGRSWRLASVWYRMPGVPFD